MKKELCDKCESKLDRLTLVQLPDGAGIFCPKCGIQELLNFYKERYEKARNTIDALKTESNLFRSLMLNNESMKALSEEPTISTRLYISQHKQQWDSLDLNTVLFWLDVFEKHAAAFSEIAGAKASKEQISQAIKEKAQRNKEQAEIAKINTSKTVTERKALTAEEKAFKSLKAGPLGKSMSDEALWAIVRGKK